MFPISNVDDAKSDWNLNETHIIIPMIDGDVINKESDKILTSPLTLNPLEAGDQAIFTNGLEHSFVIGLDKNIFETPNYKSDLVIIQNSDLKLLSCSNDLKSSVAYTLSYVDQEKSEILWQSPEPKDRTSINDNGILEVRDELDYHDSVHVLEKNEQINLANIDSTITSQISKTGDEILHEEIINEEKNEKSQFINYLTVVQNTESVPPNLQYLDASKSGENCRADGTEKVVKHDLHFKPNDEETEHRFENDGEKNLFNVTESVTKCSETEPVNLVELVKHKTDKKEKILSNNNKNKNTKDGKFEEGKMYKGVSDSLPEKSLPLKKKAKMKTNLMLYNSDSQRSLLKQDIVPVNQQVNAKSFSGRKTKHSLMSSNLHKDEGQSLSDFEMPFIHKVTKRKKVTKLKNNSKKLKKCINDSVVDETENQRLSVQAERSQEEESSKTEMCGFEENKFRNIYDLTECLWKCRMINASIWQTLNSGLKEMKVDILKEMNEKKSKKRSPGNTNYSPQLKAFALVLYFKQPAAFNYLSQVYDAGWPSLKTIKEWKRRINSHHRPNFIRLEKDSENLKS